MPERDVLARPSDQRRSAAPPKAALAASGAQAAAVPVAAAGAGTDPELEARRKRAAEEKAAQERLTQARDDAARADSCGRARAYLAALTEGKRVSRTNARGEVEFVDDKGRAEEVQRARTIAASDCK